MVDVQVTDDLYQDTLGRVRGRVAEVLALETEDVDGKSRLLVDLKADSLDLVELMYLLEQEFDLRLKREDLSLSAQLGLPEEELHENEVLTAKALELLRERFPGASELLVEGITRKHLAALLTVDEITRAVAKRRATESAAATDGHEQSGD